MLDIQLSYLLPRYIRLTFVLTITLYFLYQKSQTPGWQQFLCCRIHSRRSIFHQIYSISSTAPSSIQRIINIFILWIIPNLNFLQHGNISGHFWVLSFSSATPAIFLWPKQILRIFSIFDSLSILFHFCSWLKIQISIIPTRCKFFMDTTKRYPEIWSVRKINYSDL